MDTCSHGHQAILIRVVLQEVRPVMCSCSLVADVYTPLSTLCLLLSTPCLLQLQSAGQPQSRLTLAVPAITSVLYSQMSFNLDRTSAYATAVRSGTVLGRKADG